MTELLERPTTVDRAEDDREGRDRDLQGLARGDLSRSSTAANGARREGIEADLFFTFGLDAIRNDRYEKIKVATVGNPGMHLPT